ncbi:MAG: glycoside hydrolase family 3 C-terminal domain-containing protein [Alphaproteobacteria bacterium]|nr:glycoside hydrolase family 3 C-terminal domain-containing protein [Alphaproteobacteria bacterium]
MDASLPPDTRANLLEAQMSEDEELVLVRGWFGSDLKLTFIRPTPVAIRPIQQGTAGLIPGIARLGIPQLNESDAGVGIANSMHMRAGDTATALPSTLLTASTFDPEIAFAAGTAIAAEARARGFNVVLDGSLNLAREPRGGRTFEYAGEDPLLAGTIAGEVMAGLASRHVISTMKHFAFNDQETGRGVLSVDLDEEAMRESDLLAFEIALEHGKPGAVMCAYNRIGGVYSCENDFLLNHVLKHDWNYPGWVLSDWGGVHSTIAAALGGLDQESAANFDGTDYFGDALKQAIAEGKVPRARLDDMVHRILRSMFANGLFDDPPVKGPAPLKEDAAIARRDAEEGIVLLKNDGGALPLAASAKTIAVIGAHADFGMLSGGGSSQVIPLGDNPDKEHPVGGGLIVLPNGAPIVPTGREIYDPPSPVAAIAARARSARVRYEDGGDIARAVRAAKESEVAIVFAKQWMTENEDVPSLALSGNQDALIAAVAAANPHTIVVLETGGPVLMPWLTNVPAVIEAWYAGNDGADALAEILFGEVNPSGRLPVTFPAAENQLPNPQLPGHDWHGGYFEVKYPEGADVGYRWFEKQKTSPLFPFGFGLSYTSFGFANFAASAGDTIAATVDVTNSGTRAGAETVELYATPPNGVPRLVAFKKVALAPGETQHVSLSAEPRLLARFDAEKQLWRIAGGSYSVAAGASSAELGPAQSISLPAREMKP